MISPISAEEMVQILSGELKKSNELYVDIAQRMDEIKVRQTPEYEYLSDLQETVHRNMANIGNRIQQMNADNIDQIMTAHGWSGYLDND